MRRLEARTGFLAECIRLTDTISTKFRQSLQPHFPYSIPFPCFWGQRFTHDTNFTCSSCTPAKGLAFSVRRSGGGNELSAALMCTYEDKSRMRRTHRIECRATSHSPCCLHIHIALSTGSESEANDTPTYRSHPIYYHVISFFLLLLYIRFLFFSFPLPEIERGFWTRDKIGPRVTHT